MPRYKHVEVATKEEDALLIGLVVNDKFCQRVMPVVKEDHLQVKQFRHVLRWVREYHKQYGKAPGKALQTIFDTERERLNEAEGELIEIFLDTLAKKHSKQGNVNWEYQIDRTRDYLRRRALEVLAEQTSSLAGRGDLDRAEKLVRDFMVAETAGVNWTTPLLDLAMQRRTIERIDTGLFKMDGILGDLFGWWQPGWLVAFFGATKKGKSWWLLETAVQCLVAKLRVVFISLEMLEDDQSKRFYSNLSALPDHEGELKNPIWDCQKNQDDSCTLDQRTNYKLILRDDKDLPEWDPDSNYRACTFCKTNKKMRSHYRLASWFTLIEKPSYANKMEERVKAWGMHHAAGNLKMLVYPRGTATLDMIMGDLDRLEAVEEFVPHVIIVDYAGIMKDTTGGDEWERVDDKWKQLAALGGTRKALVVTAGQGNTKALDTRLMKGSMTAGTTRILHHIDIGISINQFGEEEDAMITRLAPIQGARHTATPKGEIYVLQNLFLGQPYMDSYAPGAGSYVLAQYDTPEDD